MDFDSCLQLKNEHIVAAIRSSETHGELLAALEGIARPNDGAPKILIAIARMATNECTWMDGELRVEIDGDAKKTTIAILSELGAGFREAVFPRLKLAVPFDEFVRAVELAPTLYAPLTQAKHATRIVLVGSAVAASQPPAAAFEVAEKSLTTSLPPTVRQPTMADVPIGAGPTKDQLAPPRAPTIEPAAARPAVVQFEEQPGPKPPRRPAPAPEPASEPSKPASRPSNRPTAPPPPAETFDENERPTAPGMLPLGAEAPAAPKQPNAPKVAKIAGWEHAKPTLEMPAVKIPIEAIQLPAQFRPGAPKTPAETATSDADKIRAQLIRPTVQKLPAQGAPKNADKNPDKIREHAARPTVQKMPAVKGAADADKIREQAARPTVQKMPAQKLPKG